MDQTAENFPERVSGWIELAELIEHFSLFTGHAWLFRGVTDAAYRLIPKVGREKARAMKLDASAQDRVRVPYRMQDERAVLMMFKQQARAYLPFSPQSELEWLAIAQHFGRQPGCLTGPTVF
jgi:FRG domain